MTTHSSILVWETPWTEDSGGLQSTGSQDLASKVPPSFSAAAICAFWYGWSTEKATKQIEDWPLFRSDLAGPKPIQASTQELSPSMLGSVALAQTGPCPSAVTPGAPAARQLPHGTASWSHVL